MNSRLRRRNASTFLILLFFFPLSLPLLSLRSDCCGDVCDNYFPDDFHYLKLHLLDSAAEDIMCVLYKVIDFIDAVRKEKKKVLVHCQQVSGREDWREEEEEEERRRV